MVPPVDQLHSNNPNNPPTASHARTQALEVIPRQLADNAGFDSTDILNLLRVKHNVCASDGGGDGWMTRHANHVDCPSIHSSDPLQNGQGDEGKWIGVDVDVEGVVDTFASGVWEPTVNKVG